MPDLDLSNRMLGEFMLREPIGIGGHGTVYRCEQRALGRDAVVKVLRPRKTSDAQAKRFGREAKLAARLDAPYSAHVYAFGIEDDGVQWIAMELVQGVSLGDWLKALGAGVVRTGRHPRPGRRSRVVRPVREPAHAGEDAAPGRHRYTMRGTPAMAIEHRVDLPTHLGTTATRFAARRERSLVTRRPAST